MKKYLTIIIIAVLLVLPTVFAVKSYVDEKNAPPTDKSVVEMVLVDLNGKTSGRGAYLCRNVACLKRARKAGRISASLECAIPDEVYDRMEEEISHG